MELLPRRAVPNQPVPLFDLHLAAHQIDPMPIPIARQDLIPIASISALEPCVWIPIARRINHSTIPV